MTTYSLEAMNAWCASLRPCVGTLHEAALIDAPVLEIVAPIEVLRRDAGRPDHRPRPGPSQAAAQHLESCADP
jgi:hypothetical protein